jgi:predicted ferric reductase
MIIESIDNLLNKNFVCISSYIITILSIILFFKLINNDYKEFQIFPIMILIIYIISVYYFSQKRDCSYALTVSSVPFFVALILIMIYFSYFYDIINKIYKRIFK